MELLLYILAVCFGVELFFSVLVAYLAHYNLKAFLIHYWVCSTACFVLVCIYGVARGHYVFEKAEKPKTEAVKTVEYKGNANEPDITGISVNGEGYIDIVKTFRTDDFKPTEVGRIDIDDISIEDVIEDVSLFGCNLEHCLTDECRKMVLGAVFKCDECGKTFPMAVRLERGKYIEGKTYIRKNYNRVHGTDGRKYVCEDCWCKKQL